MTNRRNSKKDGASSPMGGGASSAGSQDILGRVPPHSAEAEAAVLGAILRRGDAIYNVADIIQAEDFYLPAHQLIFSSFIDLFTRKQPIDALTVAEDLISKAQLDGAGGSIYLAELLDAVVSAANAEHYAGIVKGRSIQRSLINACSDIIGRSYDAPDVYELLDESEANILSLSDRTGGKSFSDANSIVTQLLDDFAERMNNPDMITGVTTGYQRLDEMTAGMQKSDLIILAARPSVGKTALALNMALRVALHQNTPVAIFSLEMSKEQLMTRLISIHTRVELKRLRSAQLNDEDWASLHTRLDTLRYAPIYIDDSSALSTLDLRSRVRRLHFQKGVGLVVIDYLQLMRSSRWQESREQEISDISRNLKALAKELNIPVVALAQLNRKVEERGDKRPVLSDLRESGAIEQDADVIMFLYRDAVYNKRDDNPRRNVAEVIIGKQRNGPTGLVELAYVSEYTAFEELTFTPPPPSEEYFS